MHTESKRVLSDATAHHFILPAVTDWRNPQQQPLPRDFPFPSFKTNTHLIRLWDCTGRLKYSKHLVRCMARAQVGVVALSAVQKEAEVAMDVKDGWTRQHLMLAYARGIRRLVGTLQQTPTFDL